MITIAAVPNLSDLADQHGEEGMVACELQACANGTACVYTVWPGSGQAAA